MPTGMRDGAKGGQSANRFYNLKSFMKEVAVYCLGLTPLYDKTPFISRDTVPLGYFNEIHKVRHKIVSEILFRSIKGKKCGFISVIISWWKTQAFSRTKHGSVRLWSRGKLAACVGWHLNAITSYLYSMILTFAKRQVCMSFTFYKNYHVCFCSSQPARIMSLWLRQTMGHWTRLERQSGNRQVTYI